MCFSLCKRTITLDTLFPILVKWNLKQRQLLNVKPRKLNFCMYSMSDQFNSKCNRSVTLCSMCKSINFYFLTFRHNILRSIHLHIFCNSLIIDDCISSVVFPKVPTVEINVVSSAYKMKLNFLLDLIMSLMKILTNKGPPIKPCCTPVVIDCIDDFTSYISYIVFYRIDNSLKVFWQCHLRRSKTVYLIIYRDFNCQNP